MAYPTEPQIEIDDLHLLDNGLTKSYKATWQEGNMIAYAWLEPIKDQPARGYELTTAYHTVSGREPGPRQREQGEQVSTKLRERMTKRMIDAGWQPIPVPGIGAAWQHESRLKRVDLVIQKKAAPVKAARQVEEVITAHQAEQKAARQVEQRTLQVSERSGEGRRNIKGYKRTITATPVTYTCERCKREATRTVYPGKRPQYCDACAVEVKREKTRARVARLRAGQKTI